MSCTPMERSYQLPLDASARPRCSRCSTTFPLFALQDQLFSELRRVLRPEAVLVGTDSLETASRRELHAGDIYTPVDPSTLKGRLTAVGFVDVIIDEIEDRFRFIASVPATS